MQIFIRSLPVERALGIYWNTDKDTFKFKINLTEKPMTRKVMLPIISSMTPFVAPYTLKGKKLLHQLCQNETAPDKIVKEWQMWCNTLQSLDTYEITRCYKPCGFWKVKEFWIHHFSDASGEGHDQVSFIRMVNCV